MKCTIITIGDELLIGQVIDTNSSYIAQRLNEIGIAVHRRIAIGDNALEITQSIQESWMHSDIIITTGGLGPTKDDITKKTIANYFGVGFRRDEQTYQHVKRFFESRNVPFLPVNEAQADVPENAEVLFNARGTAPGMWFERENKILISLPGVPYEMEYLIQTYVVEKLQNRFHIPPLYYAYIQTSGMGESFLAKKISSIEDNLPATISLAYLPSPMAVNLRLSGVMQDKEKIDQYAQAIREELKEVVYGDSKKSIEELVFEKLNEKNQTISLVESCTGGYLANSITNLSGSSKVMKGSWVVYTDEFKQTQLDISKDIIQQYSAVSKECAEALQAEVFKKINSDYAIAIVGYLEKFENITPHAFICYGSKNKTITKKIDLFYPRIKSKEAIARIAWVGLYRDFLLKN